MSSSCVIYARYSSDNQSEHSIDDQVRICRARAEREGWQVVSVFTDYALSGASTLRPGYQQLLDLIRRGGADIVLAESLDRFSRDQEHIAGFFKHAQFACAKIMTLAEGEVSELHIGLKGTMGALYLKDLADKTRRGQAGRIHAGGSAGGLSFGYRVRRGLRPDGTLISGELDIDEDQAKVIRRVFDAYNAGQSPRSIAKELNVEGIPGPRGGKWSASLLLGSAKRETGLLRNRLYIGERVWGHQRWFKDPITGQRVARQNPKEDWIVKHVPHLAVIDRTTWEGAQARLSASRQSVLQKEEPSSGEPQNLGRRLGALRRPKWPLAGLVRCGRCNGPMSVMGANGRLGCANHVERGTCDNPRTILRDRLLGRVLAGIKERLLAPDLVDQFVATFLAEVNAANSLRSNRQALLAQQKAKVERQIRNMLELIKEGHGTPAMVAELRVTEHRLEELSGQISAEDQPETVPVLHPNLPELYRRRVEALEVSLADPSTCLAATEALRGLIDAIQIHPGEHRGELAVSLRGDLAAFLRSSDDDGGSAGKVGLRRVGNGCSVDVMGSLDAGTGFEPVTFRL